MTITTSRIGSIRPADKKPREGDPLNKNLWFVSSKEARSTYVFLVILLHFILLSMPFLNTSQAWTLTNLVHAVINYYFLHICKGSPFDQYGQGRNRRLTYWEQIDDGQQNTHTRRFFLVSSVVLYLLAQLYAKFDPVYSMYNFFAFAISVIPKLSVFHRFRFMSINKY